MEIFKYSKIRKKQHEYNKIPNICHAPSKLETFDLQQKKFEKTEILKKQNFSLLKKNSIKRTLKVRQ